MTWETTRRKGPALAVKMTCSRLHFDDTGKMAVRRELDNRRRGHDSPSCTENRPRPLDANPTHFTQHLVVEAEKAAGTFPTADLSNAVRRLRGHNQLVAESLRVPFLMIALRVIEGRTPQMG